MKQTFSNAYQPSVTAGNTVFVDSWHNKSMATNDEPSGLRDPIKFIERTHKISVVDVSYERHKIHV